MIETSRLRLFPCAAEHYAALLKSDHELGNLLRINIAPDWCEFDDARRAVGVGYERLQKEPAILTWWMYLFVHRADNALIGMGGFKGLPSADGMVELGYSIAPSYQQRGLATESARGMLAYAFAHDTVQMVDAHTLPAHNYSTRILEKVGMKFINPVLDPEDGEVWHWRIRREEYQEWAANKNVNDEGNSER